MKVAVLTYPLNNNFGNLLQVWALRHFLEDSNCKVSVADRLESCRRCKCAINMFKTLVRRMLGMKVYAANGSANKLFSQNTKEFIHKEINARHYYSTRSLYSSLLDFDAVVVGSDQVWRPTFLPDRYKDYFLYGFNGKRKVKCISFAASLGTDAWEFTARQSSVAKKGLAGFAAISVREASSIRLLKEHLSVDAVLMPDPAFLVGRGEYIKLWQKNEELCRPLKGKIFCYILDRSTHTDKCVDDFAKSNYLSYSYTEDYYNASTVLAYPRVSQWLYNISHADTVITNSFHGCVFSLILNKPFIAVGNERRGNARLVSLLESFGLCRSLHSWESLRTLDCRCLEYDWDSINAKISQLRSVAEQFIDSNLLK